MRINTRDLVLSAVIAALYVAITIVFAAVSYGPVQFRLAEMLNCLVVYDKKYIGGITLGVLISNFQSSLGIIDITWGTMTTIITLGIVILVISKIKDLKVKMATTILITTILMGFLVAIELVLVLKLPFFYTWLTVSLGELGVMIIGAIFFYILGQKMNLKFNRN